MDLATRFWIKVDRSGDGCWPWIGSCTDKGYGRFYVDGKIVEAHRVAWTGRQHGGLSQWCNTQRPSGIDPFVRKDLFLGTRGVNNADRHQKGRDASMPGVLNGRARLSPEEVIAIREQYARGGVTLDELAADYGVHQKTIHCVVQRKTWALV